MAFAGCGESNTDPVQMSGCENETLVLTESPTYVLEEDTFYLGRVEHKESARRERAEGMTCLRLAEAAEEYQWYREEICILFPQGEELPKIPSEWFEKNSLVLLLVSGYAPMDGELSLSVSQIIRTENGRLYCIGGYDDADSMISGTPERHYSLFVTGMPKEEVKCEMYIFYTRSAESVFPAERTEKLRRALEQKSFPEDMEKQQDRANELLGEGNAVFEVAISLVKPAFGLFPREQVKSLSPQEMQDESIRRVLSEMGYTHVFEVDHAVSAIRKGELSKEENGWVYTGESLFVIPVEEATGLSGKHIPVDSDNWKTLQDHPDVIMLSGIFREEEIY